MIVRRLTPRFRVFSPEQEVIERYRAAFEPHAQVIPRLRRADRHVRRRRRAAQWKTFLLWRSAGGVSFGATHADPLFHRDPSFYIFMLPFQKFVQGWFFSALVGVTVIAAHRALPDRRDPGADAAARGSRPR